MQILGLSPTSFDPANFPGLSKLVLERARASESKRLACQARIFAQRAPSTVSSRTSMVATTTPEERRRRLEAESAAIRAQQAKARANEQGREKASEIVFSKNPAEIAAQHIRESRRLAEEAREIRHTVRTNR